MPVESRLVPRWIRDETIPSAQNRQPPRNREQNRFDMKMGHAIAKRMLHETWALRFEMKRSIAPRVTKALEMARALRFEMKRSIAPRVTRALEMAHEVKRGIMTLHFM